MASDSGSFKFNQEYEVLKPTPEKMYPIPVSEWNRIIERVQESEDTSPVFHSIAWGCVGVAASAFFAGIALPQSLPRAPAYIQAVCWGAFGAAAAVAVVTFIYASKHRKDKQNTRKHLAEDMRAIAARCQPTAGGGS